MFVIAGMILIPTYIIYVMGFKKILPIMLGLIYIGIVFAVGFAGGIICEMVFSKSNITTFSGEFLIWTNQYKWTAETVGQLLILPVIALADIIRFYFTYVFTHAGLAFFFPFQFIAIYTVIKFISALGSDKVKTETEVEAEKPFTIDLR